MIKYHYVVSTYLNKEWELYEKTSNEYIAIGLMLFALFLVREI